VARAAAVHVTAGMLAAMPDDLAPEDGVDAAVLL
jgi:hypothetical protein